MKKNQVIIDEKAMEACYYACEQELFQVIETKKIPIKETLLRFMKVELRVYLRIALFGLLLTISICFLLPGSSVVIISIYFIMLANYAIFEGYKNKYYHMEELITPVYLHPARVFLLKSVAIALCQLALFLILITMTEMLKEDVLSGVLLYALLPMYAYQTMLLMFLEKIRSMITAFVLYVSIAGTHIVCVTLWELQKHISLELLLGVFAVILILYGCVCLYKLRNIIVKGGYCNEVTD